MRYLIDAVERVKLRFEVTEQVYKLTIMTIGAVHHNLTQRWRGSDMSPLSDLGYNLLNPIMHGEQKYTPAWDDLQHI